MRGETHTKYLAAYGRRQENTTPNFEDEAALNTFVTGIVNKIYRLQYSDWEYFYAILFNVVVTALLTALAMSTAGISMGLPPALTDHLPKNAEVTNIIAGGIGALLWSIYEFAERYRSGDLAPDSLFRMGARMLLVGAVGALVGAVINEHLAWPVAFGVGVLPISTVRSFISERTLRALKLPSATQIKENPPFTCLQGWNQDVCEKLLRAGISSVEQLACTNPFQIFLRSNLDWRVILDLCDQALLVVYIGEKAEKIRLLGFRSAGELAEMDWSKEDSDYFSDFTREQAIGQIADALEMDVLQVKMLIRSLSEDITVSLIATLWSDDTPGDHHDEDDEELEQPNKEILTGGSPTLSN
ncbi:hypothetical protein [Tunturibacter empetritectus]|uniref:Uncharacterized protein n=1 Tax=Tunturiibacter lichenicola TaxID=2051959 RepID=A0A7W8N3J2_9BACT|nr:hypothetical protein [Edaphobacter lichenicola]MBB5344209.1 hypothetical protein [Edaphobacter lichenicola]